MSTRNIKILLLDTPELFPLWALQRHSDIKFEFVTDHHLGSPRVDYVDEGIQDRIKEVTSDGSFDLIVIGNNLGIGIMKARGVADCAKDKTVIVWHYMDPGCEQDYEDMGFKHFARRIDLERLVPEMLSLS